MRKFIFILGLLFVVILFCKESKVIETKKVYDNRIGTYTDQTNVNWKNFQEYFENIKENVEKFFLHNVLKR